MRKDWQLEKVALKEVLNDESPHPTVCVLVNSHGSGHHCVTIVGKGANRRVYDSSEKWVADHLQEPEVARRVLQGRRARSGLLRSRRCLRPTGAQISQEGTGRVAAGARRPPHGEGARRGSARRGRERERSTRGAREDRDRSAGRASSRRAGGLRARAASKPARGGRAGRFKCCDVARGPLCGPPREGVWTRTCVAG